MKCALVAGNSRYSDRILSQLNTPDGDVRALAQVLASQQIGGFDQVAPLNRGSRGVILWHLRI